MSLELSVVYEDSEVVVFKAPHDEELVELVHNYIKRKGRPVTWKELREVFGGIAGEDRLRKALHRLRERGLLIEVRGGIYATIDMPGAEKLLELMKKFKKLKKEHVEAVFGRIDTN